MGFLVYLGINAAIYLAGYLYRRYYQEGGTPKPTLDVPRNTQGAPLPVVFGRCLLEAPQVIWYGKAEFRSYFSQNNNRWKIPLHYALCRTNITINNDPIPRKATLKGVWIDRVPQFVQGPTDGGSNNPSVGVPRHVCECYIIQPDTIWDPDHPNTGRVYITYGSSDDELNPGVEHVYARDGVDTTLVPPNQGTVTALMCGGVTGGVVFADLNDNERGFNFSEVPVLPRIAFEIINPCGIPGLPLFKWLIGEGDANPACVLYNLITNDEDGRLGYLDADVDVDSFLACAETLFQEEHGYSRAYYNDTEISNVFAEVCKQIDGVVFEHPVTGKLTMELTRNDYVVADLPELNLSNVLKIVTDETVGWNSLATIVRLTYTRRRGRTRLNIPVETYPLEYSQEVAEWRNQATAAVLGVEPVTVDMPGVTTDRLAAQILARLVRTLTVPLARATLQVNRSQFFARPNQVFKVTHPDLGPDTFIMRVADVDIGEFESNAITLNLYQDRFHAPYRAPLQPSQVITEGDGYPAPVTQGKVEEAPFFWQNIAVTVGGLNDAYSQRLWYFANNPGVNTGYRGFVRPDAMTYDTGTLPYGGSFILIDAYARVHEPYDTTDGFVIETDGWVPVNATEAEIRSFGVNVWLIDDELVGVKTITPLGSNQYQCDDVLRGLGGTVPADHSDGARGFVSVSAMTPGLSGRGNLGDAGMFIGQATSAGELGVIGGTTSPVASPDVDTNLIIRKRTLLPGTPSNLRVALPAWLLTTSTSPTNAPTDVVTEGVTLSAHTRARNNIELARGDDADEISPETTVYDTVVIRDGVTLVVIDGASTPSVVLASLSSGGYGEVSLGVRSRYTLSLGSGPVDMLSWQIPTIPTNLYEFRNLLRNGRFIDDADYWTLLLGTPIFGTGPTQTSQIMLSVTTPGSTSLSMLQDVSVINWRALGMSAILDFLTVRGAGDASDTVTVNLIYRDTGTDLGSVTYGPTVPGTTYSRQSLRLDDLEYETAYLRTIWTQTGVSDGDLGVTDALVTDFTLRTGQISADLGTNMSFESGLAGWTTDVGGYTDEATLAKVGSHRVQGGANATNTIYRDFTVDEYRHGYFVVDASCMHPDSSPNSSATLTVEARTSGGTVLETGSTTFTPTTQNLWVPLLAFVRIPTAATVVRMKLTGTRLSGSNNRLSWDDCVARFHKFLTTAVSYRYQFSPSTQEIPRTRAEWPFAFPEVPVPDLMFLRPQQMAPVEFASVETVGMIHGMRSRAGGRTVPAWEFRSSDTPPGMRLLESSVGKFRTGASFTINLVLTRTDLQVEGVILRRVVDGVGWDLTIDGGCPTVNLYGASATKTVAHGTQLHQGVVRLTITYDHIAETLRLDSPLEGGVVSTTGMGEIQPSSGFDGGFLFVSTDEADSGGAAFMLASIDAWSVALTTDQRNTVWTHGGDVALPGFTGGVVSAEAAVATIVGTNAAGVIVGYSTGGQMPHEGDGLAFGKDRTNIMEPFPEWTEGGSGNYDAAEVDTLPDTGPDGQHVGVKITGTSTALARISIATLSGALTVNMTFFARSSVIGTKLISLLNTDDGGTLVQSWTFTIDVADVWQRVDVTFPSWDGSTSGAFVGFFGSVTGTPGTIDIAGPFFSDQESLSPPSVIPVSGSSRTIIIQEGMALPAQLNHEGEMLVRFSCRSDDQNDGTLACIGGLSNNKNVRAVSFLNDTVVHHNYDATTPTDVVSEITPTSLSVERTVRARWNRARLLDGGAKYAGIIDAEGHADYDRTTTFTADDTESDALSLGTRLESGDDAQVVLHELWIRGREPLLE